MPLRHTGRVDRPTLHILFSFPEPQSWTNPYVVQLADALAARPGVRIEFFAWRTALLRRYDILHTHWPELLFSGRPGVKTAARRLLFVLLMTRLALTRTPMVRTLHNVVPHERKTLVERALMRWADARTTGWICLNPVTAPPGGGPSVTIPHGHYVDWFDGVDIPASRAGVIAFAGQIRGYKNIGSLVCAFADLTDPDLRLRIVGKPSTPGLAASLTEQAGGDGRISFSFGYLPDADLAREIGLAELVVLPYSDMHNSGAALLALSLGRPILVPANQVTAQLATEVGPPWVQRYAGPLTAHEIRSALAAVRVAVRDDRPDLGRRGWGSAAEEHLDFYRKFVSGPVDALERSSA